MSQFNHWAEIAAVAADALLLLRILQLRLHRVYLFITLACVIGLIFDSAQVWLGSETRESARVFLYSRFLYAFVFPAASYDVWEELKTQLARVRRFAILRLGASLTLAAILGIVISSLASADEANSEAVFDTFAVILWAAASTASLAFLWSMQRAVRAQKIALPRNTAVWLLFYQLQLAGEVLVCFLIIVGQQFSSLVTNTLDLTLNLYAVSITLWCVWRLKGSTSDIPSAPQSASL